MLTLHYFLSQKNISETSLEFPHVSYRFSLMFYFIFIPFLGQERYNEVVSIVAKRLKLIQRFEVGTCSLGIDSGCSVKGTFHLQGK